MFSSITDVHSVKNSELDVLELARFLSDETALKVYHSNGFYEGSIRLQFNPFFAFNKCRDEIAALRYHHHHESLTAGHFSSDH